MPGAARPVVAEVASPPGAVVVAEGAAAAEGSVVPGVPATVGLAGLFFEPHRLQPVEAVDGFERQPVNPIKTAARRALPAIDARMAKMPLC
jgi:hypothetical protein